jgi:predicted Zn-dependent protease
LEANEELDKIAPLLRAHPDVLEVRWQVFVTAKKWEPCVDIAEAIIKSAPDRPFGWIHRSYALHELQRTQNAFDQLLPAAEKFPRDWTIAHNLACYTCQLGRMQEAKEWLGRAIDVGEPRHLRPSRQENLMSRSPRATR